ncbi:hypothetical protein Tco_0887161 [Tanacetum coccineum]
MSDLKFADTHNLVAFLEKPTESEGFEEIVDFLNANPIKYALTVNPTIYCSCVKQQFEQLTLMGYEKLSQKLTFYKAFFSPQWKFLIHIILQCLSAKTTAWNEFSSTMASAIICLAINQKFNFSKYIFNSMVKNVDSEEFRIPTVPSHTPSLLKPSSSQPREAKIIEVLISTKKNTEVPQPSGSLDNVPNENVPTTSMIHCSVKKGQEAREDDKSEHRLIRIRKVGSLEGCFKKTGVEVEKVVITAEVTTASATTIIVNELTLAQTLIEIKAAKPKVRGVMIQEPSEFITTTTKTTPAESKPSQDKGKEKMIESQKPLKKKDQIIQKEEEANIALIESWDNTQAMIDANYQMAQQLQAKEKEQLSIEEKLKLLVQLLEARKKHFAEMRAREKRNKPPTQAQQRKLYFGYGSEERAEDSTKRGRHRAKSRSRLKEAKDNDAKSTLSEVAIYAYLYGGREKLLKLITKQLKNPGRLIKVSAGSRRKLMLLVYKLLLLVFRVSCWYKVTTSDRVTTANG